MPMVMNTLYTNEAIKSRKLADRKLIEALTIANTDLRLVTYHGATEAMAKIFLQNMCLDTSDSLLSLELTYLANQLGHLTVLDDSLFRNLFKNKLLYYKQFLLLDYNFDIYKCDDLYDMMGLTTIYNRYDIDLINNNWSEYRLAFLAGKMWMPFYIEDAVERNAKWLKVE